MEICDKKGQQLGYFLISYTSYIPEAELYSDTKGQLMTAMDRLLAGRIAEELIYGDALVSTRSKGGDMCCDMT